MVLNAAAVIVARTLTSMDADDQFRAAMRQSEDAIDSGNAADVLGSYS